LERVRVCHKPPAILTPEQAEAALDFTRAKRRRWLAYLTLAIFAGIRPDEILRLTWDCVSPNGLTVRIDAAASKVRRRRIVHLQPNAAQWLHYARSYGAELGTIHPMGLRRYRRQLSKHLRFGKWPQDLLRHTCASYLLAHLQDAGKAARELGNSPGILLNHYQELVEKETAEKFWAIVPPNVPGKAGG